MPAQNVEDLSLIVRALLWCEQADTQMGPKKITDISKILTASENFELIVPNFVKKKKNKIVKPLKKNQILFSDNQPDPRFYKNSTKKFLSSSSP